jgi:trans-2,3-dihydro-3-hydroxyanthranilate isomerase
MATHVLHFDVFALRPGKGNPAGIVLSADNLDDGAMQEIARTTSFNDTAFISSSQVADFRIRYFSPRREVDLCGHATIAAAIALHTRGPLSANTLPCGFSLETKAGILPIVIDMDHASEKLVFMSQAPAKFEKFNGDRILLMRSLGIATADIHPDIPIVYGSTGRWTLVVPVRSIEVMRKMQPRPTIFAEALSDMPEASIHPFCFAALDAGADLHARHFSSPSSGTVEDPVTGTASGVLGAYYREFVDHARSASQPLVIEQGCEMGREGRVLVWAIKKGDSYSVRIAGNACFVDERTID